MPISTDPPKPGRVFTFAELAQLEPRLAALLTEAQGYHDDRSPSFCANAAWYGYGGHPGIKLRLLPLVGWERGDAHPVLATHLAYNVAYDAIYEALPNCRNCACWSV